MNFDPPYRKPLIRRFGDFLYIFLWPPYCLLPVCAAIVAFCYWLESLR